MKQLEILVVEDMAQMRSFLKLTIEYSFANVRVDAVSNGADARSALMRQNYDLILCDWEMPGMKGDELFKILRENPDWKDIPFIMVTAMTDKEHVLKAVSIGVSDYIIKPVSVEVLVKKMAATLPALHGNQ